MKRSIIIPAVLLLWIILVAWGYLLSRPALIRVTPGNEQGMVAANVPLRLEFSHRMQDEIINDAIQIDPVVEGEFHWEENTLVFTPQPGWPSRTVITLQLAPGVRTARWPWLPLTQGLSSSFTVRPPLLLYLFPAGGAANLYLRDLNTQEWVAQTEFLTGVFEYDVDLGREWVYYSRANDRGGVDIYRRALQFPGAVEPPLPGGLEETQVTFCGSAECREPRLSPDGEFLAYERTSFDPASDSALIQVWLVPLDQISATGAAYLPAALNHQTLNAAWSANGWLAFYNSTLLAHTLVNPHNGETITLQNETAQPGVWATDGSAFLTTVASVSPDQVLLPSGVTAQVSRRILLFDLTTLQARDLTGSVLMDDAYPSPAPNGTWLAFARRDLTLMQWIPGRQLWLMELATGESHPLTSSATSDHYDFTWTPDSAQLAFVRSDQAALVSPPEIWVIEPGYGFARRLVTGGFAPRWVP